ncbi:hypothetical protein [Streptomyces sp. NBC_01217]|uniref:hypothetical protein n=1 Tax=Streptomyces sp. NBC_01217 TaxID=2903779 RepID=UPI002E0E7BF3|nr:hypothetical protein OG507_12260 [Streptomyces sp. NBC_01217]
MVAAHLCCTAAPEASRNGEPDPPREIASSLHRFQTRRGRRAYSGWYRSAAHRLTESGLAPTVESLLLPAFPRAAYYPDFLPPGVAGGPGCHASPSRSSAGR